MSVLLALTGLALLALPGLVASAARQLRPSEWRRLNRVAVRLGFGCLTVGLALAAVPMLMSAAGIETVAEVCHHLLGPVPLGGAVTGTACLIGGLVLIAAAVSARRRLRRMQRAARIEGWCGEHTRLAEATFVILPTDSVVAYATPGSPAQVVVSRGLSRALTADELNAVVRHELAHLRHGHHRDMVLAGVIDATLGWIPWMHASTTALRLSIERSADEEAAERPGARDATRRALLKTTETMLGAVPAFTTALTLLARLEALALPPPDPSIRRRAATFAPLAALGAVAAVGFLGWSVITHHSVLHLVGDCPF
jgi:hypothetical protein